MHTLARLNVGNTLQWRRSCSGLFRPPKLITLNEVCGEMNACLSASTNVVPSEPGGQLLLVVPQKIMGGIPPDPLGGVLSTETLSVSTPNLAFPFLKCYLCHCISRWGRVNFRDIRPSPLCILITVAKHRQHTAISTQQHTHVTGACKVSRATPRVAETRKMSEATCST